MKYDVLIVGGGLAGLSAALLLGRCHRKALLCDEGQQRNLSSPAIHGLFGREGRSPAAFLGEARQELTRYNSVSVRGTRVTDLVSIGGSFEFTCADGTTGNASKILLATGLVDELPELAGIEPLYGISIHHCLYCDGFEYAGKPVAALGKGDKRAELALMHRAQNANVRFPSGYDQAVDPRIAQLLMQVAALGRKEVAARNPTSDASPNFMQSRSRSGARRSCAGDPAHLPVHGE